MIYLAAEMAFESPNGRGTEENFEAFLDCVLDELDKLDCEADVTASLANKTAIFAVGIEEETFEEATANFMVTLRTALHAAECVTADWPTYEAHQRVVRELAAA